MRGQLLRAASDQGVLPEGRVQRRLAHTDVAALGRLMADAYCGTIDDPGADDAWHLRDAEATLQGRYGRVVRYASLVAVDGAVLAGTCLVTDTGDHLLLAFALVVPRWRSSGVGTTLIRRSARALLAASHQEWTLAVTEGNPAVHLYERLGFTRDDSLRRAPPG